MTSHPLLHWSLGPQMLTEAVVGAVVWMNNFPALQLKSHKTQRGRERQQSTKTKQASGLGCPVSSGPCHAVLHVYPAPDEQPLPSSISPGAGVKTWEMSKSLPVWTPHFYSLLPFPWLPQQGQTGLLLQETGSPQSWGCTARGAHFTLTHPQVDTSMKSGVGTSRGMESPLPTVSPT